MMEDLYARLVAILERDWPASCDDWIHVQEMLDRRLSDLEKQMDDVLPWRQCYPDPGALYGSFNGVV